MSKKKNKNTKVDKQKRAEEKQTQAKRNKRFNVGIIAIQILVLLAAGVFVFLNIYVHATDEQMAALEPDAKVQVHSVGGNAICFEPANAKDVKAGVIFYPENKVQAESYAPLMHEMAAKGITCVLEPMPYNIVQFRSNAADGVQEALPNVKHWYMVGHAAGGNAAVTYAKSHADAFDGAILMDSKTNDILTTDKVRTGFVKFDLTDLEANNTQVAGDIESFIAEGSASK